MRRLCALLGMPQNRFASIHVVGTNGKTSVARMTAALLEAHGVSTGAYVSPHVLSWRERILIGGEPISEAAFAEAIERCRQAAEVADRSAGEEGPVTQFELVTAAAFVAFVKARVKIAVIEAGLGGRLDATNVIPSKLTVLTSVGLDHTEWLGETVEEIAAEKLAVLRDHAMLIRGEVPAEVEPVIEHEVERRHAKTMTAPAPDRGGYQADNWELALLAAEQILGDLDPQACLRAARISIPGRAQVVQGEPPLIYDAAHNPDGARALAESLPELSGNRPVVACLALLAEKDAGAVCEALAPACAAAVCTEFPPEAVRGSGRPVGEAMPAADLAGLWRAAGGDAETVPGPLAAWERARELAAGRGGVALAAGSHYLLRCLWTEEHAESS
ncbi:MAG: bifunctional folylpolyglutamate synthase/dihydrofolate synthase [Solirubrobacterales bacterium]